MQPHRSVAARRHAITNRSSYRRTLPDAIDRLGFVQADPIRSPARAQDLILRHTGPRISRRRSRAAVRVAGRRGGLPVCVRISVEARCGTCCIRGRRRALRASKRRCSRWSARRARRIRASLEAHLGKRRVVNAWGGYSKATTHALEVAALARTAAHRAPREWHQGVQAGVVRPTAVHTASERLRALIMVYAPHLRALAGEIPASRSSRAIVSSAAPRRMLSRDDWRWRTSQGHRRRGQLRIAGEHRDER